MHNREHIVILRPGDRGILMHTMYYTDEIRKVDEFRTDTSILKDKELELARTLIESLAAEFEPEKYKDTYRDNLKSMIEAKVQGREIVETPAPTLAPVIDIMEALKKSLAEQKKPIRSATAVVAETETETEAPAEPAARKRKRS